jgi:hypothetical protein
MEAGEACHVDLLLGGAKATKLVIPREVAEPTPAETLPGAWALRLRAG